VKRAAVGIGTGVLLSLASAAVDGSRLEVQDRDCPAAPQSCARPVVVSGSPISYISDFHGISPVGSTSFVSALLGEDHFRPGAFVLNALVHVCVVAAVWMVVRRAVRR
jgi:hypothetical protein